MAAPLLVNLQTEEDQSREQVYANEGTSKDSSPALLVET